MPENGQRISVTSENSKMVSSEDEQKEIIVRKAKKRNAVADELENHPVFKTLKKATADNNIRIMLDAIVDRYFEFSSDTDNNLQNQDYFEVSPTLIGMALAQTIYLINKTENGLVLDIDGTQNKDLSMEQRMAASSDTMKEQYKKMLEEDEKDEFDILKNIVNKSDAHAVNEILNRISLMTTHEEIRAFYQSAEGQQFKEKALSGEETTKDIKSSRVGSNLEKAEDVMIMSHCKTLMYLCTRPNIDMNSKQAITQELVELEKYLGDRGAMLKDEKSGKVDLYKALEHYLNYSKAYANKENLESIKGIGQLGAKSRSWEDLTVDEKKEALEAMYTLYTQVGDKKAHKKALIALTSIEGLTKWKKTSLTTKEIVIDEEAFLGLYNSVNTGKNINKMEKLVEIIAKNQKTMVDAQIDMLDQEVKDGTFRERTNEQAQEHEGKSKYDKKDPSLENSQQSDAKVEEEKEEQDEEENEQEEKKEENLFKKINGRLRENYRKAKMVKVSENVKKMFSGKKMTDETMFYLMISTYSSLTNSNKKMRDQFIQLEEDEQIPKNVTKNLKELFDMKIIENVPPKEKMDIIQEKISQARYYEKDDNPYIASKIHSFIETYKTLQEIDITNTKKLLADYMMKDTKTFGRIISPDADGVQQIDIRKLNGYLGQLASNKEELHNLKDLETKGIDTTSISATFSKVAMHKRTPGYLLRGSIELAKDALGVISRRINYGANNLFWKQWGKKALPEGTRQLGGMLDEKKLQTIAYEYTTGKAASAMEKKDIVIDAIKDEEENPTRKDNATEYKKMPGDEKKFNLDRTFDQYVLSPDTVKTPMQSPNTVDYTEKYREEWGSVLQQKGFTAEGVQKMSLGAMKEAMLQLGEEDKVKEAAEEIRSGNAQAKGMRSSCEEDEKLQDDESQIYDGEDR